MPQRDCTHSRLPPCSAVDCCAFAYDGSNVLCTARAMRAAVTRCNAIDLQRRSCRSRFETGAGSWPDRPLLGHCRLSAASVPPGARTSRGCSSTRCAASPSPSARRCSTEAASICPASTRARSCLRLVRPGARSRSPSHPSRRDLTYYAPFHVQVAPTAGCRAPRNLSSQHDRVGGRDCSRRPPSLRARGVDHRPLCLRPFQGLPAGIHFEASAGDLLPRPVHRPHRELRRVLQHPRVGDGAQGI